MKLEVGMYVKSNNNFISKIIAICPNREKPYVFKIDDEHCEVYGYKENQIKKASFNLIDLIEEKDLLEIEYFSLRYEKRVTRLFEVTYKEGRFINLDNAKCQFILIDNDWTDNDKELEPIIKSIVTKEQFENIKYSLEG